MPWLSPRLHFLPPSSPFLVHHHSWDVRRGGPRTHFDITQEDGEQGWEGFSTLAGFLEGAGGSLKMNSFQLSEHLQGLAVAAS